MTALDVEVRDMLLDEAISDGLAYLQDCGEAGSTLVDLQRHLAPYRGAVLTDALRLVPHAQEVQETAERRLDAGGGRRWMVVLRLGGGS